MSYSKAKVYRDGSHYIAISHTERPYRKRVKPKEMLVFVAGDKHFAAEIDTTVEDENVEGVAAGMSTENGR